MPPGSDDVENALRAARREHPSFVMDAAAFASALARLDREHGLASLAVADLYVAYAAAYGCPEALAAFEVALRAAGPVLRRMSLAQQAIDETLQAVRTELLVAPAPADAKILRYSGRGRLAGWLRAVAVRAALRTLPDARHDEYADALHGAPDGDLELSFMKRKFGAAFADAFKAAAGALSVADRLLLKQRYAHRVGVVDLARIHGVTAGTISKRVAAVRARLVEEIRDAMIRALGLRDGEVSSVLRLIESQVDITFSDIT